MNVEIFVQNVQNLCKSKGTTPTVACQESGAGRNFMDNVKKGSTPSVAKVQMLAEYLGVTTSDLLGEAGDPDPELSEMMSKFGHLTPEQKAKVIGYMEGLIAQRG